MARPHGSRGELPGGAEWKPRGSVSPQTDGEPEPPSKHPYLLRVSPKVPSGCTPTRNVRGRHKSGAGPPVGGDKGAGRARAIAQSVPSAGSFSIAPEKDRGTWGKAVRTKFDGHQARGGEVGDNTRN